MTLVKRRGTDERTGRPEFGRVLRAAGVGEGGVATFVGVAARRETVVERCGGGGRVEELVEVHQGGACG